MDQAVKERRLLSGRLVRFLQKYGVLCLILAAVTGVCFLFSCRKSGMFIDEIYTYGLSNSHYAPYIKDAMGGTMVDKVITRQDLLDYVSVNPGEGLDFGSVYYNQVRDVHPPLYYWLFNLASSLTPGVFSKWTGLALDFLLYLATLLLLWRLCLRLFKSRQIAGAGAALYGLSVVGLSTMLMIRMYVLLTCLSVLLACLIARLWEEKRLRLCPLVGLTVFLGLMTQYYYVFYAFFLCGFTVLALLWKREFKLAGGFFVCAFAGALLLPLCFPACFDHLFADKLVSGGNAVENLRNVAAYWDKLYFYAMETARRMKAPLLVTLFCVLGLLLRGKRLLAALRAREVRLLPLLFILPALITFAVAAIISPVLEIRYIYNLIPFFVLAVCFLLHLLARSLDGLPQASRLKYAAVLAILALAVWEARCLPPDYLYPEHGEFNALLAQHAEAPCVYLSDDYFPPITQDLLMLLNFDQFFVTDDPASPALADYLASFGEAEECVVFIDVDAYWSSGFDPDVMLPELLAHSGYTRCEELYRFALSQTYLLTVG